MGREPRRAEQGQVGHGVTHGFGVVPKVVAVVFSVVDPGGAVLGMLLLDRLDALIVRLLGVVQCLGFLLVQQPQNVRTQRLQGGEVGGSLDALGELGGMVAQIQPLVLNAVQGVTHRSTTVRASGAPSLLVHSEACSAEHALAARRAVLDRHVIKAYSTGLWVGLNARLGRVLVAEVLEE